MSLQFNEPNMFSITLHQGYHLKIANNIRETSNPFARVYATGLPNKYETKVRFPLLYLNGYFLFLCPKFFTFNFWIGKFCIIASLTWTLYWVRSGEERQ